VLSSICDCFRVRQVFQVFFNVFKSFSCVFKGFHCFEGFSRFFNGYEVYSRFKKKKSMFSMVEGDCRYLHQKNSTGVDGGQAN
jgi:hypothetical protein